MPEITPASDPITAAIESSMADAGLTETSDSGDTIETVGSSTTEIPADEAAAESVEAEGADDGEPLVDQATVETQEEKAAREAEDAELTIKPGENAIPHSRVKKMTAKAEARGREAAAGVIKERDTEISRLRSYETEYRRFNELADTSAERLIEALAVANPKVWKPIQARLAGAPQVTGTTAPATEGSRPMPKPNVKQADGSFTYDEEGLAELLKWNSDETAARVSKQFNDRLTPFEQERRAAEFNRQQAPMIKAQISKARERWGDLFEADYQQAEAGKPSEIIQYMNANKVRFEDACTAVLLPKLTAKLKADKTAMRKSLVAEINERPAAASGTPRAAVKAPAGSRTMEQVIKDSMDAAGLK
jgi:hypothetical protein